MKQSEHTTKNEFTSGLDLDSDALFKRQNVLSDAFDVRLIGYDGKNFTVTNVNGNDYQFNLPANFTPLGYAVYNGIAYIVSWNAVNGTGQIGSFPSPKPLNVGGFDRLYKPLQNWTGATNPAIGIPVGGNFTTDLFNFDLDHQVQAFARIDYDDSVNFYFVDNKNVFRVINSGFNQLGFKNDRYYWIESFNSIINVFNSSSSPVIVTSMIEDATGNIKCGNWFYFFRYTTADFNSTSFLSETGPVQISKTAVTAIQTEGNSGTEISDKAVNLTLTNVDVSYPFIEIGYIHYFDGSFEVALINQLYAIDPSSTTLLIKITGTESTVSLTASELISTKIINDIPKTAVQLENSAWLGNLKGRDLFNPDLLTFANNITVSFDDNRQLHDTTFSYNTTTNNGQYKYYLNTFESVGYFRGETYAFGVVFVFNDGKESQALPVTGFDDFYNTQLNSNIDGIYRFPAAVHSPFKTGDYLNVLAVQFDTTAAFASTTTWFNENVQGYYFVRGKRNANLIYQGIALQCYYSHNTDLEEAWNNRVNGIPMGKDCPGDTGNLALNWGSQGAIPLLGSTVPYRKDCHKSGDNFGDNVENFVTYTSAIDYAQTKYSTAFGLYSPDFFFINAFKNGSYKYTVVADCDINHGSANYAPYALKLAPYSLDELQSISTWDGITVKQSQFTNVPEWSTFPLRDNTFVSMFDEATLTSTTCFSYRETSGGDSYVHYLNRAFATTRYLGFYGLEAINLVIDSANGATQSINVTGDYTNLLGNQIPIQDACFNNGTWSVLAAVYDSGSNTTTLTLENAIYPAQLILDCPYIYTTDFIHITVYENVPSYGFWIERLDGGNFITDGFYVGAIFETSGAGANDGFTFTVSSVDATHIFVTSTMTEGDWESAKIFGHCDACGSTITPSFDRKIINIYTNDPVNGYVYTDQYDIKTVEYFKISQFKFTDVFKRELVSTCYNGDSFLQRTYIKQLGNPEVYTPTGQDNASSTTYDTFGVGMSVVTENNYNTAMRGSDNSNTYYPKLGLTSPETFFAHDIKRESTLINVGYNVTLSPKAYQGFDKDVPFRKTKYPTRIAFSNRHDPNSLKDGYRTFDLAAYKDFDYRLGEITCLVDYGSILLNIQQFGISNHPITEKTMLNDGSAGSLTLGTGERLPLKPISVTDLYGSQHQWSIFKTPLGVYGVDVNKRKIWKVTSEGVELVSDTKKINSYTIDTINSYGSSYSDIVDIIADTPILGTGITIGYDQRYGDIIFTFVNTQGESNTICYNDKLQMFTSKYNFKSPFYISLNDNFYSSNPNDKSSFFLHDVATVGLVDNKATWYGTSYKPYIEFYVNQYSDITKIFDNLQLVSEPVPFESIQYNTEQQVATQNPFIPTAPSDMYTEPKYRENLWRMAIKRATGTTGAINNPYSIASILRGKAMKVKLTFKEKTPNAIKSVLSYFKISKS